MFNRYAYANNSPFKYKDPTGRGPEHILSSWEYLETVADSIGVDPYTKAGHAAASARMVEVEMMKLDFIGGIAAPSKVVNSALKVATSKSLMAFGKPGTASETFKAIGSLKNLNLDEVTKFVGKFGFSHAGKTKGGYTKYVGSGSNTKRLEIHIRPNGQVMRLEKVKKGHVRRFDDKGKVTQKHDGGEKLKRGSNEVEEN